MNLNQADASHADKIAVEGPDRCVVIGCDRGNQEVGKAEALSGLSRTLEPIIDARPRSFVWKENRKRGECATELNAIPV